MKIPKKYINDIFNATKIALSCVISTLIASYFGLKYSMTAGLITVLSIQDTKKETVSTALKRLGAFFVAMIISIICFKLMDYTIFAFGVYIFIFVIVCCKLEWKSAIVPISVLVTHLIGEKTTEFSLIINELLIFTIGAGMGIIVNLHLHKNNLKMHLKRKLLDDEIKGILERMSKRILTDDKSDYNGDCFDRIQEILFQAEQIAYANKNNAFSDETYDEEYLKMRRSQCSVLYEMYKSVIKMNNIPKQSHIISEFLYKVSIEYHEKNDVKKLMAELDEIFYNMRYEKMPESRNEFENRAVLYSLMLQLKEFLSIKYTFMQK